MHLRSRKTFVSQPRSAATRAAHLALALLFFAHQSAWAAVIPVSGGCTLSHAITAANSDSATGSCPAGSGADTVQLTGPVSVTFVNNSTDGPNGLPSVISDITLEGNGHTVTRSSASSFRLFHVAASGTLTLDDVTLTDGDLAGYELGAAILNRGTTTLTNSTVSGNYAFYRGGGVSNLLGAVTLTNSTVSGNSADSGGGLMNFFGTVTLTNSTLSGNSATTGYGGGIRNEGGTMTLTRSTVSGNTAGYGAGVWNETGVVTLTNSTVSGNSASIGGGLVNYLPTATLTLVNSTVSGNSASNTAGGLYNADGVATLQSSIVANSTGANCAGMTAFTNGGNNFDDDGTCPRIAAITGLDGTLADNGGPTLTHALLAGSNAIDAAGSCGLATDQRGAVRPVTTCDSGAFEIVAPGCGNGVVDAGEQCDDANTDPNDCCSATCQFETGPGAPPCCDQGVCQVGAGCGVACLSPTFCQLGGVGGTECLCAP